MSEAVAKEDASTLALLERAWERTDELFGLVRDDCLGERPIRLRHGLLFYLGHMPAFTWNMLCGPVLGRTSLRPEYDELFAFGIDPDDEAEDVPSPEWPALEEVVAYRDAVRCVVREGAADIARSDHPMAEGERALHLVLEHELMHHETLLYGLQELRTEAMRRPASLRPPRTGDCSVLPARKSIPAGEVRIGARFDELDFGWDNEFPTRAVEVDAFEIDSTPVTIGRYLAFVEDGGYEKEELWSARGWAWARRHDLAHPKDWVPDRGRWRVRALFENPRLDQVAGWPVSLSWAEADAFARWKGGRLPTEPELRRAAYTTPDGEQRPYPWGTEAPDASRGNLDFARLYPTPVGSHPAGRSAWGLEEPLGNGWEWTSTEFAEHPGFEAYVPGYEGYSRDFFDGAHYVVLGGSWATGAKLLRPSFRNWFRFDYPYPFTKFRIAWDV